MLAGLLLGRALPYGYFFSSVGLAGAVFLLIRSGTVPVRGSERIESDPAKREFSGALAVSLAVYIGLILVGVAAAVILALATGHSLPR